jgi:hypothetical protein
MGRIVPTASAGPSELLPPTSLVVWVCVCRSGPTLWSRRKKKMLWVRGHHVRAEPARAGSVFFWGALRCLSDSQRPEKKLL